MKKERPILFSTPMVQAILNGNKTQTRRTKGLDEINKHPDRYMFDQMIDGIQHGEDLETLKEIEIKCPFGKPGDVLYVKEKFTYITFLKELRPGYASHQSLIEWMRQNNFKSPVLYYDNDVEHDLYIWKPSIYMSKMIARIWLEIIDVRVERLQDISEKDAISEGIHQTFISDNRADCAWKNYMDNGRGSLQPKDSFNSLWESINGADSWSNNPWVWVVEFKRIEKP